MIRIFRIFNYLLFFFKFLIYLFLIITRHAGYLILIYVSILISFDIPVYLYVARLNTSACTVGISFYHTDIIVLMIDTLPIYVILLYIEKVCAVCICVARKQSTHFCK